MKILFVTSEVAPFAKTGGLGDVGAALPRALGARDHDVRVFLPLYRRVRRAGVPLAVVPELRDMSVTLGRYRISFSVLRSVLPDSNVPVYFVDCPALYDRDSIYTQDDDEHLRFILLDWAALLSCQRLGFSPDILHANDWQAGLCPLLLKTRFDWDRRRFARTRSVLTIHNLAHQGVFRPHAIADAGLEDSAHLFHQEQLREGVVSFMLTGILYATAVTTVSPTYAREIQTDEQGCGLGPYLRERSSTVMGIVNGIDDREWDPQRDRQIARRYAAASLADKVHNKKALLQAMRLPYVPRLPVAGIVSRLVWQKGMELVFEALPPLLARGRLQLVVLGSGAGEYEHAFATLQHRFPKQVCFYRGFSDQLAHMIEAGADMFLMPSRFEPCGLNQLYSLRYGTVPIVRKTGGLADTVQPFDRRSGEGNGFLFDHFTATGLHWALEQALSLWPDRDSWRQMQRNGMRQDYGWGRRVRAYEALYERVMEL